MAEEVKAAVAESEGKNFIDAFIEEDIAEGGRFQGQQVHTRFPPEPNGYLHIGHCKALTIDFGTAERFGGLCNLRMDDTNPTKEDVEFVDAIKEDIHWLGFDWGDRFFYGSDYFEKDYEYAVELIKKGLAYVCDLTPEEAKEYLGGFVIRSGKTGLNKEHNHIIEYSLKLDSNPEFTASVLVAYARAVYRMKQEGMKGCKTVFDVAPAYLSPMSGEELRAHLL